MDINERFKLSVAVHKLNSMNTFPELNRKLRGHAFYEGLDKLPALYSTEDIDAPDKTVLAHYFVGGCDWWIVEFDQETHQAFGYAILNNDTQNSEWGYADLIALEGLVINGHMVVERDYHWTPTTFRECIRVRGLDIDVDKGLE